MRNIFLTVLGLFLLLTACSSGNKSNIRYPEDKVGSAAYFGVSDNFKCVVPCIQHVVANEVKIDASKMTYTLTFISYDSLSKKTVESKIEGNIKPSIAKYPVSSMNTKNIIYAVIKLDNQKVPKDIISAKIIVTVKMDADESFAFTLPVENIKGEKSMLLIPEVTPQGNSVYDIKLNSIRLANRENEYLPSSELMRVGIASAKGKSTLWSSNDGMNFMTVIKKVQPAGVGEIYVNSIVFDKSSDNVKSMPAGNYYLHFVIPAKPEIISTEIDCYLGK